MISIQLDKKTTDIVQDLVCQALYGHGTRYWARIELNHDTTIYRITDLTGEAHEVAALSDDALSAALARLVVEAPFQVARLFDGRWDETTGDALLQCLVYGKLVWG